MLDKKSCSIWFFASYITGSLVFVCPAIQYVAYQDPAEREVFKNFEARMYLQASIKEDLLW